MGMTKRYLEDLEVLRAQARSVLFRAGVLDYCDIHEAYFDTLGDITEAYRLGNALVTRGEIDLHGFTRRDFTDAMQHELRENTTMDGCAFCAHAMAS